MEIENLLTIENWASNPHLTMEKLLGSRKKSEDAILLAELMKQIVQYSEKTWNRTINQYDVINLESEIESRSGMVSILDVGCGDGNVLAELKGKYLDKINCYGISVMNHPHSDKINYHICPAEVLPESWDNKFDIVVTHQAFRYMLFPEKALRECIRVTRSGGIFAGYIGTIENEDRVMYNQSIGKEVDDIKINIHDKYNNTFDDILRDIPYNFQAKVWLRGEYNYPHAIKLKKDIAIKEIQFTH